MKAIDKKALVEFLAAATVMAQKDMEENIADKDWLGAALEEFNLDMVRDLLELVESGEFDMEEEVEPKKYLN
jgi:hypothetical protein